MAEDTPLLGRKTREEPLCYQSQRVNPDILKIN